MEESIGLEELINYEGKEIDSPVLKEGATPEKKESVNTGNGSKALEIWIGDSRLGTDQVYLKQEDKYWFIGNRIDEKLILDENLLPEIRRSVATKLGYYCETNKKIRDQIVYQ